MPFCTGFLNFFKGRKGILICFTGVDGSGKTTHAKSLLHFLSEQGFSCSYVWGASVPFLSYLLYGFTRLLGYWKKIKKGVPNDPLELAPFYLRRKALGWTWRCLLFIDFHIKTLIKIRLPLIFGKVIICDRYVYDMIMELMNDNLYSESFGKIVLETIPTPKIVFLMDVPEGLAHIRRTSIDKKNLSKKRMIFLSLARSLNFFILNSSSDFVMNQRRIRNEVFPLFAASNGN